MSLIVTPGILRTRAELYHQLGSTLSAGIPLIQSLEMVRARGLTGGLGGTFATVIRRLQEGDTFSGALEMAGAQLPSFDAALLSAGEQSGRLDGSFRLLALYYETRSRLARELITGMLPTLLTLHVFLFLFPLDFLVAGVTRGSWLAFFQQKALVFGVLYGGVFAGLLATQDTRRESWRLAVEKFLNLVPILTVARRQLTMARLSAALEALISAGVPLVRAWELAAAASGSADLKGRVSTWRTQIDAGVPPSELVMRDPFFPKMFSDFYRTGETTGTQDETLRRLHLYYQDEGFRNLRLFNRVLGGVVYGIVSLMVAYYVISFYAGYFSRATSGF